MSSGEARFAQLGLAKVERLRDKVLKFLEQNPGDRIGAADAVGLTMSDLRELECRYPDGFVEVDDRYVAKLEKLIARAGLGLPLLDVGENFKIDHAIKALKVMKEKRRLCNQTIRIHRQEPGLAMCIQYLLYDEYSHVSPM